MHTDDINKSKTILENMLSKQSLNETSGSIGDWQPMESAPNTGRILMTDGNWVGEGHYYSTNKEFVWDSAPRAEYFPGSEPKKPLYWMHKPKPPVIPSIKNTVKKIFNRNPATKPEELSKESSNRGHADDGYNSLS